MENIQNILIKDKSLESNPAVRMRRVRSHPVLRTLARQTRLSVDELVLPLFVWQGESIPLASIPGHTLFNLDRLPYEIENILELGISSIILFGVSIDKDEKASLAYAEEGIVAKALRLIKKKAPGLLVIADVCLCGYTSHGHCGIVRGQDVDNDETLTLLKKVGCCYAHAGADVLAPSGMMDHVVSALRAELSHMPILSYAVKYASSYYGGFRESTKCSLRPGDSRSSYQMDHANCDEAVREVSLDLQEGADMVMVKPAGLYLDVIARVRACFPGVALGAYQVSGEYGMIKAAAEKGWLDEKAAALESLIAIKRAGAQFIITYFAKQAALWLR